MTYKAYAILVNVMILLVGGVMALTGVLLAATGSGGPPIALAGFAGGCLGAFMGLLGLISLGMSFMLPPSTPCPSCGMQCSAQVNFWSGRLELHGRK